MNATFKFDPVQMQRMKRATDELAKVTGRSMPNVVRLSAIWFAKSALKRTPIAPKKIRTQFIKQDGKWVHTDKAHTFKPKGRGFAKAGWVKSLRGLGRSSNESGFAWGKAWQLSGFTDALRKFAQPHVIMSNSIPYIETLNRKGNKRGTGQHFMDASLKAAATRMSMLLDHHAKELGRAWRRVL